MTTRKSTKTPNFRAARVLDAQIEGDLATRIVPGLSASVVCGGGRRSGSAGSVFPIWRARRRRRRRPSMRSLDYELFTATMLMSCATPAGLRLDDPVQDYLAEVPVPRRHPDSPAITFRHLVTHTSGRQGFPSGYWDSLEFPPVKKMMAKLAETEQPYPPGASGNIPISHCADGFRAGADRRAVLGILGRDLAPPGWARPPEVRRNGVNFDRSNADRRPAGRRRCSATRNSAVSASAAACIRPSRMAKIYRAAVRGTAALLSRATVEEMHRPQYLNDDWAMGPRDRLARASRRDGSTRIEHGGGCTVYLSGPAVGAGAPGRRGIHKRLRRQCRYHLHRENAGSAGAGGAAHRGPAGRRVRRPRRRGVGPLRRPLSLGAWHIDVTLRDGGLVLLVATARPPMPCACSRRPSISFRMPGGPQRRPRRCASSVSGAKRPGAARLWWRPHRALTATERNGITGGTGVTVSDRSMTTGSRVRGLLRSPACAGRPGAAPPGDRASPARAGGHAAPNACSVSSAWRRK